MVEEGALAPVSKPLNPALELATNVGPVSTRASQYTARVETREELSPHLVRLTLAVEDGFASTGIPDEWVGLVVPGQFQSRYYTVRSCDAGSLVLDVVLH